MSATFGIRTFSALLATLTLLLPATIFAAAPEPGPEAGGLRMRFVASPGDASKAPNYSVQIELVNVSQQPVTVRTAWESDADTGDLKVWLEGMASIESTPAFAPWRGGLQARFGEERTKPQPSKTLQPGETLSVSWQSEERELKRRVLDPFKAQNPTFAFPGLYSVHVNLEVITEKGTFRLRSNEQLVSFGGSNATPKFTYGRCWNVSSDKKRAMLDLGSYHKVQVGDRFMFGSGKQEHWILTITEVDERFSSGTLEARSGNPGNPKNDATPPENEPAWLLEKGE